MFKIPNNVIKSLYQFHGREVVWFYLFFPALCFYFYRLHEFVNEKPIIGRIEVIDPSFSKLLYTGQNMEIIATNLSSVDGPVWVEADPMGYLVFSDTAANRMYRWDEGKGFFTVGKSLLMRNTGCTTNLTYCQELSEPGSSGGIRIPPNKLDLSALDLLLCQQGERGIGVVLSNGSRQVLVSEFKGRRFNSPKDLVWSTEGHVYFTDPRYGLMTRNNETLQADIPVAGVYLVRREDVKKSIETGIATKNAVIVAKDLTWPYGLAFSPDFSKLYISNSDFKNPIVKVYDLNDDGSLGKGKVFYNASGEIEVEGSLKGIKVDIYGNVFISGPDGILVVSQVGNLIGRLVLDRPVSNLIFGADGRLYITAKDVVVRMWIKTKPNRILKMLW